MRKSLFAILIICMCSLTVLTACEDVNDKLPENTPVKLVMGELSYDDSTKTVSWDKVANASGYELKIGSSGVYSSNGIAANGNKMQYVLDEAETGNYDVYVKALGNGTDYTTSDEKHKQVAYTKSESGDTSTVPQAPQNFIATSGSGLVVLSWTAPVSDGGSAITKYEVKKNSDAWITASSDTGHTFTGLTNGTEYTFKVRAVNAKGNSAEVNATATPTAAQTISSAPQSFTATAGNGQVVLSWTAPESDGGSVITHYEVSSDNGIAWLTASSNTGHTFTGLINGTLYTFKVRAINAVGNGTAADVSATPATVASAPQNFTATAGDCEVLLEWDPPMSDGGSAIITYEIFCDVYEEAGWQSFDNQNFCRWTYLTNGIEHTFKVRAVNAMGDGAETAISATPATKVSVPQNFTATAGNGQVTLSWTAPLSDGGSAITRYEVSSDNGSTWITAISDTGHTFTGLTNGTLYTFKVRAVNVMGEGEPVLATATPAVPLTVPSAPQDFTAIAGNGQVTLTWTAPESNGGSAITSYDVSSDNGSNWITASSSTGHTFTGLTNGNEYTFKVRAVNEIGNGAESTTTAAPVIARLVMETLTYNDTTKLVTWNEVTGASGYSLRLTGSGVDKTIDIGNNEKNKTSNKFEYEITETLSGTYYAGVTAKGDSVNYIDSYAETITVYYTFRNIISAGGSHSLTIDADGNLWGWGMNNIGQIGDGTETNRFEPVQIMPGTKFIAVSAGGSFSLALDKNGNLWSWGYNLQGQLGNGTNTSSSVPVQIKAGTKFSSISAGTSHGLAIDSDGSLWAWGENYRGQIGDGTTVNRTLPVKIRASTKFNAVSAGEDNSLAIDSDGNLWSWGFNYYGAVGDGSNTNRPSPVQIKAGTKFVSISAGGCCLAIDKSGNLWAWGDNSAGNIGDGTKTNRNSPVQIKTGTKFIAVNVGTAISLAIDASGNLWAWGQNTYGQLGNGTTTDKTSPVQIKAGTVFSSVSSKGTHTIAIDAEGNLWSWGRNRYGQLGNSTATDSSLPVQISIGS